DRFRDSGSNIGISREVIGATFEVRMLHTDESMFRECLQVMIADWEKIGVHLIPVAVSSEEMQELLKSGSFETALVGVPVTADPDISAEFDSSLADAESSLAAQWMGYQSGTIETLLKKACQTFDISERRRLYQDVQLQLQKDLPCTFLCIVSEVVACTRRLHGVKSEVSGLFRDPGVLFVSKDQRKYQ
ncbi:MAG: hypothetical protein PHQ23_15675, partial [Candidatus Wallbacteria bacterium]|nr:hypothetical protein [Candidatus Wallbacteria bacterium]